MPGAQRINISPGDQRKGSISTACGPRYQRSRGAELCSNALVPPKFSDVEDGLLVWQFSRELYLHLHRQVKSKYRARELLDRALQARIDRKQEEANCQHFGCKRHVVTVCMNVLPIVAPFAGVSWGPSHVGSIRCPHTAL